MPVPVPAPGVPGRAGGRLGVGPAPVLVPPGRGADVEGRSSCRATGAGVEDAGRGAPGRAEPGVAPRVDGAPGADGVGGFRVDGAVLGGGGVRVEGAVDSADVRATGADGTTDGRGDGALGAGGVRVDGAKVSAGVRVGGAAVGRGALVSVRAGADGRGALGVADVVLGADGTFARAAGAAGASAAGESFSLRRRITGASRVDEGDLTNSPMSLAIERTALLSTPSSLASS